MNKQQKLFTTVRTLFNDGGLFHRFDWYCQDEHHQLREIQVIELNETTCEVSFTDGTLLTCLPTTSVRNWRGNN